MNLVQNISQILSKGRKIMDECYYRRMCWSRFRTELKLKHHLRHSRRHGYQSVESISGENYILRSKNFQNLLLDSEKVELDIKANLADLYDPSNSSRVKEHETIAVSYTHVF